eukprot:m.169333 g.169333  ORF g.169333 m.169333 type:complete len:74 (-) comp14492_c2_seq1:1429-1650(-)
MPEHLFTNRLSMHCFTSLNQIRRKSTINGTTYSCSAVASRVFLFSQFLPGCGLNEALLNNADLTLDDFETISA